MPNPIIVVDHVIPNLPMTTTHETFRAYLDEYPKKNEASTLVINLCATRRYLDNGYYCSLLAEARRHKVLPTVNTINELTSNKGATPKALLIPSKIWKKTDVKTLETCNIFLGQSSSPHRAKLAAHIFSIFPAPLLLAELKIHNGQLVATVRLQSIDDLNDSQRRFFAEALEKFVASTWRAKKKSQPLRWDMAILHNPAEATPPSDEKALKALVKAAAKHNIHAVLITPDQADTIDNFDALFIRETTAIDHHTYRLARYAEQAGLVVIDDATSILRSCNKVYLQDAFSYSKVPTPKSLFIADAQHNTLLQVVQALGFPMVLKLPESAFSLGVHKVKDMAELQKYADDMLAQSALILAQEYIPTDFDWRIGMLAGRPLYACRYFMARNHWQIYNHNSKRFSSGGFETLAVEDVPQPVLDAAVKAAKVVGNGLYGVDIKQVEQRVYVIEVNDNPSLDAKIEDKYLGKQLYEAIMAEFALRLEAHGH
ncbi:RimK family protein [Alteromonas sp. ASW11-36]|uniref:RimK family protein n=1 Tax=Alteromonas arenosi TaxID=3055817 RepID=A0ABT7SZ26_9ALTE|nr:RimK family protein [Alteromonas sp. ASW11-36]MDM7861438.1 RimK family protein [Alteromonas sp. ASW11-36]